MHPKGLKPHDHQYRTTVIEKLVPIWREKFGENLLGIGASASYARGDDIAYSDLEIDLFLKKLPVGEDPYYQRVVDGMLIEAVYHTPVQFLQDRSGVASHWYISASDRYQPVYNAPFFEKLMEQSFSAKHTEAEFLHAAARERYELQESFGKVLNAVELENVEGVSLLVMDAALHLLRMLAFVNQHSFTTFSRFISEARRFAVKPERFDEFLDVLVQGTYQDLPILRKIMLAVLTGMEKIFADRGIELFNDPFDPNTVTSFPEKTEGVRLVPVNSDNFQACVNLPTGPEHKYVAPNSYSIAQAQFTPGSKSCCVYVGEELVGFILYRMEYDDEKYHFLLWISRLMIAEPERGKGYGRSVLKLIIEEAFQTGCVEVGLSTHPENSKAITLYESIGFHAVEMVDKEMVYVLPLDLTEYKSE